MYYYEEIKKNIKVDVLLNNFQLSVVDFTITIQYQMLLENLCIMITVAFPWTKYFLIEAYFESQYNAANTAKRQYFLGTFFGILMLV